MKTMFASLEITQTFSNLFSAYASLTGFAMLMRSMVNDLIPHEIRSYLTQYVSRFFTRAAPDLCTIIVQESTGDIKNQLFEAAEIYLRTKMGPETRRLRASKTDRQRNILASIEKGEEITDLFESIELTWAYVQSDSEKDGFSRYFEVSCESKFRDTVLEIYLPRVIAAADKIKQKQRTPKLHSRSLRNDYSGGWGSVYLEHPSTFDTLALDADLKQMIIDDLKRFLTRKELYRKVGKAWKRGYLLYGPPGTGKSSLIAAMANYLKFDVYELELSSVHSNSELKRILLSTSNRSILVIEDIDCSDETMDRTRRRSRRHAARYSRSELTLSGILNCIDGLWSSCGDERIFIFTTNHKDRLDPALLRPGRMDVHIHLSYTTVQGFRILVSNYLGIEKDQTHHLISDIEPLIETTNVTPAEIAEELLQDDDPDVALRGLLSFLEKKKIEQDEEQEAESDTESTTTSSSSSSSSSNSNKSSDERERRRVWLRRRGLRLAGWRSFVSV